MLDEQLLEQFLELLGPTGVEEMYATFADNIGGYIDHLQNVVAKRNEEDTRRQAHQIKGACRSVGLSQLAKPMEHVECDAWQWDEIDDLLEQWVLEVPLHQHQLKRWLKIRAV